MVVTCDDEAHGSKGGVELEELKGAAFYERLELLFQPLPPLPPAPLPLHYSSSSALLSHHCASSAVSAPVASMRTIDCNKPPVVACSISCCEVIDVGQSLHVVSVLTPGAPSTSAFSFTSLTEPDVIIAVIMATLRLSVSFDSCSRRSHRCQSQCPAGPHSLCHLPPRLAFPQSNVRIFVLPADRLNPTGC